MRWFLLIIGAAIFIDIHSSATAAQRLPASAYLSTTYYLKSCPSFETIIHQKVNAWVKRDYTLAPAIIRLHFHDCAVRGCDASILLNRPNSERTAEASKTLRGFSLIDDIKAEVEKKCPKTVSCADILTAAARDATVLAGGPFWEVPFGRKDGKISVAKEANSVPQGYENVTSLLNFFDKMGLTFVDLVVLSGCHTVGRSTCAAVKERLYNFRGTGKADPSMNAAYVSSLKKQCGLDSNYVNFDATSPRSFDAAYYANLGKKMGLLSTDQLLYSDVRTAGVVGLMGSQAGFFKDQFLVSMVKLGNVNVLTGRNQGEVRLNCNRLNA
ncbi:hypothetical protein ABFS82_13G142000 [Erythranthe guttata]|uniref:Peroxidase n=1 Tax=Erythranthe guttata TaxID=4155 RepID=A0A022QI38_ERYGU|nr:hypothetical protein MIMGU_mgv1a023785mg [Erythranthe guttata]